MPNKLLVLFFAAFYIHQVSFGQLAQIIISYDHCNEIKLSLTAIDDDQVLLKDSVLFLPFEVKLPVDISTGDYRMVAISVSDPCNKKGFSFPLPLGTDTLPQVIEIEDSLGYQYPVFSGTQLMSAYNSYNMQVHKLRVLSESAQKLNKQHSTRIRDSLYSEINALRAKTLENLLGYWRGRPDELFQYFFLTFFSDDIRSFPELSDSLSIAIQTYAPFLQDPFTRQIFTLERGMHFTELPAENEVLEEIAQRLNEEGDKVRVVDFWATWCGPCIKALPELRDLHNSEYGNQFGIIGVSIREDKAKSKSYLKDADCLWPNVGDKRGVSLESFGIKLIPSYVLFDEKGFYLDTFTSFASLRDYLLDHMKLE